MGGGTYSDDVYRSSTTARKSAGTPDFAYTATAAATKQVHPNLDPKRINSKPFGKLESRDSVEHPESNAVLMCFDVTGSNFDRAVDAQKRLSNLMALLTKYLPEPQVAIAANDDYKVEKSGAIQFSDFESDNRIDEHIRNVWLVGLGGGNDGESYSLLLYAAARKTVLDCVEKRGKKGYMFMYADEPFYSVAHHRHNEHKAVVEKEEVKAVFGDDIEADIPLADIIEEVKQMYNLYVIWPQGGFNHAREQYVELFGEESVITSQHPDLICELVASIVGLNESKIDATSAVKDLVAVGLSHDKASSIVGAASTALAVAGSTTQEGLQDSKTMMSKTVKTKSLLERMEEIPSISSPKIEDLASRAKNVLGFNFLADRVLPAKTLSAVLKELDIQPYKQSTVDSYKAAKLAEVKASREKSSRRGLYGISERVLWKRVPISEYKKAIPEFALRKAVQVKEANPHAQLFVEELQVVRSRPVARDFDPFLVASTGTETFYIEVWDEKKFESRLY